MQNSSLMEEDDLNITEGSNFDLSINDYNYCY